MSAHNIFAPSAAQRWVQCPGSMSCADNYADYDAGEDAAEGSGAHAFADRILRNPERTSEFFLGETVQIGERVFTLDAEMAMYIDVYVGYCRNLEAGSGLLMAEQRVKIDLGYEEIDLDERHDGRVEPQSTDGTADCMVPQPGVLHVIDLKYGKGVKVYAKENFQAMLYAKGALDLLDLLGPFDRLIAHIVQPRLDHIDVWEFTRAELEVLCQRAANSMKRGKEIIYDPASAKAEDFNPGDKQCRWCRFAECPARAAFVQNAIGAEFESLPMLPKPDTAAIPNTSLATKYQALPIIKAWVQAITYETQRRVLAGAKIIGNDGLPMKAVEGRIGNRAWTGGADNAAAAEAALVGQFADAAYEPKTIVSPTDAEKLLKAKIKGKGAPAAREALWADVFAPLISRAPGQPIIVLGSDEREEYRGNADIEEFSNGDS